MPTIPPGDRDWLIWDGECGFCRKAVRWFERHDAGGRFTILPSQEAPSPPMTDALRREAVRSVLVITRDGEVHTGGRAVLVALERAGWHPVLMKILRVPPFVWAVNAGYRLVANNRALFSRILFRSRPGGTRQDDTAA